MTIDISKIRPGDKVTLVPLEVVDVAPAHVQLKYGDGWIHWVAAYQIAAHHPAPREFQVGDRVWPIDRTYNNLKGVLKSIVGDKAWVLWDNGNDKVWNIKSLTLAEGGE